jgi:glycosyltransferase involved in cell wall biosynthesis
MTEQPVISIVLCTYNNADSLTITLKQIAQQTVTEKTLVELIVVDNNSPDHTAAIVKQIQTESPMVIRYVFEGRQGLSHARNTGVEQASGRYILFTDDDADIPQDWVSSYLKQITETAADCLFSKIDIIWNKPQPWWYSDRFKIHFASIDYGNDVLHVIDNTREFIGKNFCIKKESLIELGGFDPALGRSGEKLAAGEETFLYKKLINSKKSVIYFPNAAVGHRLKDREYTEENIERQILESSRSTYYISKITAKKTVFGRPLGVLKSNVTALILSIIKIPIAWLIGNKAVLFFHSLNVKRSLVVLGLWASEKQN